MDDEEKIKDYEKRVLAYMLYYGYIGDKSINEDVLIDRMEGEGWLDMPYERILALLRKKGLVGEDDGA
jgi:hypothetical protein